jgi:tRNA-2-methylthio-N6-dimethylallyladenosine synthase
MKTKDPKTFFIRTYGCQMNELESEVMVGQLKRRGLKRVLDEAAADLLLYNTCSIRDLAERKVMGKLGQLGRSKMRNKLIGVTGCMAMAKKETLFKKLPHVDFVIGTNNLSELNNVLDDVIDSGQQQIRTEGEYDALDYTIAEREHKIKGYVSIIRGCDKYCTYCVVPYTRGQEVSRPHEEIEREVRDMVQKGYKEVTLLGQNVNSYGKDRPETGVLFHDLLYKLDKIEGLERVRFLTSHPIDISIELMEAVRDLRTVCEFVHFPLQAGSNRILKKMHRIYTKEQYLEKVALLRSIAPNAKLGTDIIVGFCSETDAEFEETYQLFDEISFSVAFIFAYSPRKGTPAMRWADDVPEEVKQERLHRLLNLYEKKAAEERMGLIGTQMEVLVEGVNKNGQLKGTTRCWKNVVLDGDESLIGSLQKVDIHGFNHSTLTGPIHRSLILT